MKSGIISFFNIDEGRFSQVDEFQCMPHLSRYSWGLFRRRIKLLCRKCSNYIGDATQEKTPEYALVTQNSVPLSPRNGGVAGTVMKYDIRIRSLQPSSAVASLWVLYSTAVYTRRDILQQSSVFHNWDPLPSVSCISLATVLLKRWVWLFDLYIVVTICILFLQKTFKLKLLVSRVKKKKRLFVW